MKNRVIKSVIAAALAACLFCGVLPFSSFAVTEMVYPKNCKDDGSETAILSEFIDTDALREYLKEQFKSCPGRVDISDFKIPSDQLDALRVFIWREIPECFHVHAMGSYYGNPIPALNVNYTMSPEEYAEKLSLCEEEAARLVDGIAGNDGLSDVEKALLLHDRLALHNEYDYTFADDSATMYAALVKRNSVCEGYARAYSYLLRLCGIECTSCVSFALNHSWNLVKIDGQFYHVDVTWDDPSWMPGERGIVGYVGHDNFLRSNDGIKSTKHTASDYYAPATDTKYDNYFWQNTNAAFQLVGDDIYYIDGSQQKVMRLNEDGVTGTPLCSVEAKWSAGGAYYWKGNFAKLYGALNNLFFSNNKKVFLYDLTEYKAEVVLEPALAAGESIYGLSYEDGCIICDINDCPGNDVTNLRQIRVPYSLTYTVTFKDYDGSVISSAEYAAGADVTVPDVPERQADETYTYSFSGWDKPVTTVTENAEYTATYSAEYIDYTVIFYDCNGGVLSEQTYHYGDAVTAPAVPDVPANETYTYAFDGWDKEVTTVEGDAEYHPVYTATYIEYGVTFKDYDNSVISSAAYHYGDTVDVPADPQRPADETFTYAFDGWDKPVTDVEGDAEYTATYTSEYREYTVRFVDYDGSILNEQTYRFGDAVNAPEEPVRPADETYIYAFNGWDKEVTEANGNAEYTATYLEIYIDYTVTFCNPDGSVISSETYHYGDAVTAPAVPDAPANETYTYAFDGWDKEVTAVDGDAEYTATFKEVYREYTVIFKDYDGTVISSASYHYGDAVDVPDDPQRPADETFTYAFDDWDKAVTDVGGDAEYTAIYTSEYIEYTVKFVDWDGVVLSELTYRYGEEVDAPNDPERAPDGEITYVFTGWDKEIKACTGDETYTATYKKDGAARTVSGKITANKAVKVALSDADGNIISQETAENGEFDFELADGAEYITISADGYIPMIYKLESDGETEINTALKLAGDVNADRAVNNKDVTVLFRYVSGVSVRVDADCADTNGDGSINNKDVTVLFRFVSSPDAKLKVTPIIMY